jgi:hypothetical protein
LDRTAWGSQSRTKTSFGTSGLRGRDDGGAIAVTRIEFEKRG